MRIAPVCEGVADEEEVVGRVEVGATLVEVGCDEVGDEVAAVESGRPTETDRELPRRLLSCPLIVASSACAALSATFVAWYKANRSKYCRRMGMRATRSEVAASCFLSAMTCAC